MLTKEKILEIAGTKDKLFIGDLVKQFKISRQYAGTLTGALIKEGKLIKIGATKKAFYVLPKYAESHQEIFPFKYSKTFRNKGLEEDSVLNQIREAFPALKNLPENVHHIFTYTFLEMFNNAIEHSKSTKIKLTVSILNGILSFEIQDSGIGAFNNVMKQCKLKSELEAIQDILKGKTSSMPKSHSGQGIFFTSKAGDIFILQSFGLKLTVNNELPDIFVEKNKKIIKGTRVTLKISMASNRHLIEVFEKYTNIGEESDFGFDKTEIRIKLYTMDGMYISRSEARRVLTGLEKFRIISFDFTKVETVGQAFADEIFRVFHNKYPHIKLETENMAEEVKFMVERAKNEAEK